MLLKKIGRLNILLAGFMFAGAAQSASAGDIVITEIMQNPSAVADSSGEWFEVFNQGTQTLNLNGWTIRDAGSDSHTISQDVFVASGAYAVLGRNSNSSTNGGVTVAYQYSGITLANGADEVILDDATGTLVDQIFYDGGPNWPDPAGASMELSTVTVDNNVASNWATAVDPMSGGDLGTPGAGPDVGSGGGGGTTSVVISEIMQNPSAVTDSSGEWFEIYNSGTLALNLNGWTIRDNGSDSHTIAVDVLVQPGAFAVLGRNSNTVTNGGITVAYQYSGITLANGADEVILEDGTGALMDEASYDGGPGWPDPAGASMELQNLTSDNNVGSNWATATNILASGDKATPGTGPAGGGGGGNQAPVVNAGVDKSLVLSSGLASTTLAGSASDPDLDALVIAWSVVSGDATAISISAPSSATTNVDITALGTYTLQLSADDGILTSTDTVVVTVTDVPTGGGAYTVYFGNTHAHTEYSDGNKANNTAYLDAANSFRYARDIGGLDWIIMSDHNHATAGMAIADYHSGVTETAIVDAEPGSFTPLYGMEWGTISSGGHVITVSDLLWGWEAGNYDVLTPKGDYNTVFAQAVSQGTFIELCHPSTSHFDGIFSNAYNAAWDNAISLIAVKSGPAFATNTDLSNPSNGSYQSRYFDLLLKGYHLSPTADQDTHYDNWGLANQQRTAVLATDNSRAAILEALTAGRVYATEDRNVLVDYTATANTLSYVMSDTIAVTTGTQVSFDALVTDPDGETTLQIELLQGTVGGGAVTTIATSATGTFNYSFTPSAVGTTFFLIRVTQSDTQQVHTAPIWVVAQ